MDNTYWKNSHGMVTKSDSESVNLSLAQLGWVRITRSEYRKALRAKQPALDARATGGQGNEVDE